MRSLLATAVFQTGAVPGDGSVPLAPYAQSLSVQQYTDCRVNIAALDSAGEPFDISGGTFVFTVKARPQDAEPIISLEASIDDGPAGQAHLVIGSVNVSIPARSYGWNLVFVDSTGYIWPVVAEGVFAVPPSEYIPGQAVQVPSSQQPLAQGPNVANYATRGDFPSAASKPWLFAWDEEMEALYLSDGADWMEV